MPIVRQPIASLDPAAVAAIQADMTARLSAALPGLDFRRGVYHDRILYLSAILAQDDQTLIDLVQQSQSLLDINANPALADDTLVDAVLSNFRVTRNPGANATGPITIVVSALAPLTIPVGMTFEAGAVQIQTTVVTAVRTDPTQLAAADDRVLVLQPDGNYNFTIPATAVLTGISGMLTRGTALVPDQPPPFFVKAYVQSDFSGGSDTETNAALVARLQAGIAAPTFSNRINTAAMIQTNPTFAGIVNLSIIGSGDPELNRARHSLFPISLPGYCDIYVRAAQLPLQTSFTKTAVLVGVTATGGIWQFSLARTDAPGFYEISQIIRFGSDPTNNGYGVTSDVRNVDLSPGIYLPDIAKPIEGAYSRYQTAVIQFIDTDTPTVGLTVGTATQQYTVTATGQPQLAALQDYLGSRKVVWPAGDVLVKGAVPCFLRVEFTLFVQSGVTPPDTAGMAQTLANTVNGLGFAGILYASQLVDSVASYLPAGTALGRLDLFGRIRRPDGQNVFIRDPAMLTVPNDPDNYVTPRTVVFVLNPTDVSITVAAMAVPNV